MTQFSHPAFSADPSPINKVTTERKLVALTYDDGPEALTLQLMKLIEADGGKATFFVVGKNAVQHPEIVRLAQAGGHEIGNHSYSHPHLPQLAPQEMEAEILRTQDLVEQETGRRPVLFRAPYLQYNKEVVAILNREGLAAVNANSSVKDWDPGTTVKEIIQRATGNVQPGDIILMHSWSDKTLAAMPEILRIFREKGFRLVTVSELLALKD